MKNKILILIGIIIVIVIIFLLQNNSSQSAPIKIGFIGPLTGDDASGGQSALAGAKLAEKEINNAGGILGKPIKLISEDDACSAAGGINAMNKLVNFDKVVAITGPDCGSAAGSALPLAVKAGVPVIIRWASVPGLTSLGDNIFRNYPSDAFQGAYDADYMFNKMHKKNVAVLFVKNPYGQGMRDVFVKRFTELGGKIIYEDSFDQNATDIKTQLTKTKALNPEAIFYPVYRELGVIGVKQMKEINLNVPILAGDAFEADEVIKNPAAEGVLYSVAVTSNPEDFQKRVIEATGQKGDIITAPLAYDAVNIIAQAIERAGSLDEKAISDELKKTSYKGISYPIVEFGDDRELKNGGSYQIMTIHAGKSVKYSVQ